MYPLFPNPVPSPLLGLQNFSMPCLIRTIRDSSVKDSMTLKLHRGLTSKKVMPFFSAYALACSVGTCRLKARCRRLPTRIRGTPGACWEGKIKQRTELTFVDSCSCELNVLISKLSVALRAFSITVPCLSEPVPSLLFHVLTLPVLVILCLLFYWTVKGV